MTDNSPTAPAGWYDNGAGSQQWWDGTQWGAPLAPQQAIPGPNVPGRVPGFVLGLLAAFFVAAPFLCLPLGIVGWVQSSKAMRRMPVGTPGRGLAVAGLVLSIGAVSVTTLLMLLAIPGAWQHNFG